MAQASVLSEKHPLSLKFEENFVENSWKPGSDDGAGRIVGPVPPQARYCPAIGQSLSSTTIWGRSSSQPVRDVIKGSLANPAPPLGGPLVTSLSGPEATTRVGLFPAPCFLVLCVCLSDHGSFPANRRAPSTFLSSPDEGEEAAAGPG